MKKDHVKLDFKTEHITAIEEYVFYLFAICLQFARWWQCIDWEEQHSTVWVLNMSLIHPIWSCDSGFHRWAYHGYEVICILPFGHIFTVCKMRTMHWLGRTALHSLSFKYVIYASNLVMPQWISQLSMSWLLSNMHFTFWLYSYSLQDDGKAYNVKNSMAQSEFWICHLYIQCGHVTVGFITGHGMAAK